MIGVGEVLAALLIYLTLAGLLYGVLVFFQFMHRKIVYKLDYEAFENPTLFLRFVAFVRCFWRTCKAYVYVWVVLAIVAAVGLVCVLLPPEIFVGR